VLLCLCNWSAWTINGQRFKKICITIYTFT